MAITAAEARTWRSAGLRRPVARWERRSRGYAEYRDAVRNPQLAARQRPGAAWINWSGW